MYIATGILTNDQLATLAGLAARLLPYGSTGSFMTSFDDTKLYLRPVVEGLFPGVWTGTTVVGLLPSQQIVAHVDQPIVGLRHHIPLQQNESCWSFSDGVWQHLELGVIYQMDPTKPHGAVNWGSTIRLHLIVDHLANP